MIDNGGPALQEAVAQTLLQAKLDFFRSLPPVLMTWWVSSVPFCSSLLGGAWVKRRELMFLRFRNHLASLVLFFLATIVAFGVVVVVWTFRWEGDVRALIGSTPASGSHAVTTELAFVRVGMLIGTSSFVAALAAWIILWHSVAASAREVSLDQEARLRPGFAEQYAHVGLEPGRRYPCLKNDMDSPGVVLIRAGGRNVYV